MDDPFTKEDMKLMKQYEHNRLVSAYEDANDSMGKYSYRRCVLYMAP